MSRRLRIDGVEFDISGLSEQGRKQLAMLQFADSRIAEMTQMLGALTRAKANETEGLRAEIVKAKSGVDLSSFLSD